MTEQQLIPFQPTYSQGIGSLQPYQAPVMPPMAASPQNNMQSAPTTQYSIPPRQPLVNASSIASGTPTFQPTQPTQPVSNSTSAIQYDPATQRYSSNPAYVPPPPPATEVEVNTGNEGGSDYARGGAVNQGQGLASLGRGQDSMLVHMTPGEVQGLQQLAMKHGGSLTTNPQTGLPEAGILSSLLPLALGFALGPAGLQMSSLAAAATVGGIGALATGSLSKGLMYGLGAYGGSELGSGLQGVGAQQAEALKAAEINQVANTTANTSGSASADTAFKYAEANKEKAIQDAMAKGRFTDDPSGYVGDNAYRASLTQNPIDDRLLYNTNMPADYRTNPFSKEGVEFAQSQGSTGEDIAQMARESATTSSSLYPTIKTYSPETQAAIDRSPFQNSMQGIRELTGQGTGTASDAFKGLIGNAANDKTGVAASGLGGYSGAAKTAGMALAPAIPDLMKQNTLNVAGTQPSPFVRKEYSFSQQVNPNFGQPGQPYYLNQGYTAAAKGGAIGDTSGIMSTPRPFQKMSTASLLAMARGKNKSSNTAKQELAARQSAGEDVTPQVNAASGGLMNFAGSDYAAGGKLLRGPGDGMSDSIPAVIKGKNPQRAALADGEFVIPADVVSHLGNGSTEAGSRHLYSMMDKVRKARTGNPKQGKQINAARFMPA